MEHTPGPVETLARLGLQSNYYRDDADFRDAVDDVIGNPVYDKAPEMKEALEDWVKWMNEPMSRMNIAEVKERSEALLATLGDK